MNEQLELEFDDGEIFLEKKDVFMYNVPVPVNTNHKSGYHRASDWDVTNPIGTCTLIMSAAGNCCHVQLEDDSGHVFGQSVITLYPGRCGTLSTLSPVADSSRYFTLKLQQYSGGNDFIGLGFVSHKDSADVTKTLENFFAYLQNQLMKAVVEVPIQKSDSTVETRTKLEVVEYKFNENVPNFIFKLENGDKREGNLMNLNIESNAGSGHPNSVVLNPDSKTVNSDLVAGTELATRTSQTQIQLASAELQQATSTEEPEQKIDNKSPNVIVKLENDHQKKDKNSILIIEPTGTGSDHSDQGDECKLVETVECPPVFSYTEVHRRTKLCREKYLLHTACKTLQPDSQTGCTELSPRTS